MTALAAFTLAAAMLILPAGGSDAPPPYTVDAAGVTLPAGHVFVDGGHVNIRTTSGSYGIHFEALNNQPSGEWIGASFLPWSAFGLDPATVCVEWVQVAEFNEHFGEGEQPPVGAGCAPAPTPVPTTSVSPTPSQSPVPSASPTASPAPSASPTQGPQPAVEGTGPTPVPLPDSYATPAPSVTALPVPAQLAATGSDPAPGVAIAAAFLLAGLVAFGLRRAVR